MAKQIITVAGDTPFDPRKMLVYNSGFGIRLYITDSGLGDGDNRNCCCCDYRWFDCFDLEHNPHFDGMSLILQGFPGWLNACSSGEDTEFSEASYGNLASFFLEPTGLFTFSYEAGNDYRGYESTAPPDDPGILVFSHYWSVEENHEETYVRVVNAVVSCGDRGWTFSVSFECQTIQVLVGDEVTTYIGYESAPPGMPGIGGNNDTVEQWGSFTPCDGSDCIVNGEACSAGGGCDFDPCESISEISATGTLHTA